MKWRTVPGTSMQIRKIALSLKLLGSEKSIAPFLNYNPPCRLIMGLYFSQIQVVLKIELFFGFSYLGGVKTDFLLKLYIKFRQILISPCSVGRFRSKLEGCSGLLFLKF